MASEDVSGTVADVWREVLNVDVVGDSSVFFADGGDSLDAVIFLQRVNDLLAVELSIEEMFLQPDFASITAMVRERGRHLTDNS